MDFSVLICDDSSLARKMAERSLPENFVGSLYQAENGQQALSLLQEHRIQLLLLDLTMPVLDGIGVLEEIKRLSLEVFVIVISGDIQPQMRERAMGLGALDFIVKPINSGHLSSILNRYGLY